MTTRAELRRRGDDLRSDLFGAQDGDTALANPAAGFGELMSELVYGSIWSRP